MRKINSLYFYNISNIYKNHLELDFKSRMMNADRVSFTEEELSPFFIGSNENTFPLVVLIGGVAGSGKSSFISFCKKHMSGVFEESTIDCCRSVADYMAGLEDPDNVIFQSAISQKTEDYRTLLSKLKQIWCEFDDGPNTITLQSLKCIWANEPSVSAIFVNVREPEQIEQLKKRIESELDAVVLTLAVLRNDPEDSMNSSDQHTLEYAYDIWIKNSMCLEELEFMAVQFCLAVENTSRVVNCLYDDLEGI